MWLGADWKTLNFAATLVELRFRATATKVRTLLTSLRDIHEASACGQALYAT